MLKPRFRTIPVEPVRTLDCGEEAPSPGHGRHDRPRHPRLDTHLILSQLPTQPAEVPPHRHTGSRRETPQQKGGP